MGKIRKVTCNEPALLMNVKLGSRCAFEQLYHLHRLVICNNLRRLIRDEGELLMGAIETLSPQRKRTFRLCKMEGKSYEEVSRILGISSSTISDHIVKATKTIRHRLICQPKTGCILFVPFLFERVHDMLVKII